MSYLSVKSFFADHKITHRLLFCYWEMKIYY